MDTFPYESWDDAIADADGTTGYYTWAQSGIEVVLVIIAIALAVLWMLWLTRNEDGHLNDCASKLNDKWGI